MNDEIRAYISQLKYWILKEKTSDALQKIDDIQKILHNSVVIPKDSLQFKFTETIESLTGLCSLNCQILSPTRSLTYDIKDEFIRENKKEFIKYAKEQLKNKLIDDWSVRKNDR